MSSTAWPEGVVARYLTVGGAHVVITTDTAPRTATCNGCDHSQSFTDSYLREFYIDEYVTARILQDAREWAQRHAETCRAVPKPTV